MFGNCWLTLIFSSLAIILAYYWGKSIDNTLVPDYAYPADYNWCHNPVKMNDSYLIEEFNKKYDSGQQYFFYVYDHEKNLMMEQYQKVRNSYDNGVYDSPRFIRSPVIVDEIDRLFRKSDYWIIMPDYKITDTGVRNIIRRTNNTKLFNQLCESYYYMDLTKYEMAFLYHYLDYAMEMTQTHSIFDKLDIMINNINCWFHKINLNMFSKCEMNQLLYDTKNNNWFDVLMSRRKMYDVYNIFPTNDLPHIPTDIWYHL
jgi:hypothetical protein